jgi:hypothetical protein
MSRQDLPRGDMTVNDVRNPNSSSDSSDDDVEDDTDIPSPRTHPHGKGKRLASATGSGAVRDEIEEESKMGDDGGDQEEDTFDVEEINPSSYLHMGTPIIRQP